jgi:hypothetical protein
LTLAQARGRYRTPQGRTLTMARYGWARWRSIAVGVFPQLLAVPYRLLVLRCASDTSFRRRLPRRCRSTRPRRPSASAASRTGRRVGRPCGHAQDHLRAALHNPLDVTRRILGLLSFDRAAGRGRAYTEPAHALIGRGVTYLAHIQRASGPPASGAGRSSEARGRALPERLGRARNIPLWLTCFTGLCNMPANGGVGRRCPQDTTGKGKRP